MVVVILQQKWQLAEKFRRLRASDFTIYGYLWIPMDTYGYLWIMSQIKPFISLVFGFPSHVSSCHQLHKIILLLLLDGNSWDRSHPTLWGFPQMGGIQNGWLISWKIPNLEMDDLGATPALGNLPTVIPGDEPQSHSPPCPNPPAAMLPPERKESAPHLGNPKHEFDTTIL